jgi:hypothetical protein
MICNLEFLPSEAHEVLRFDETPNHHIWNIYILLDSIKHFRYSNTLGRIYAGVPSKKYAVKHATAKNIV